MTRAERIEAAVNALLAVMSEDEKHTREVLALRFALAAPSAPQGEPASPYGIGKEHIQIVGATEAQVDAFNADPAGPWVIYFTAPGGATAQMRAVMQMHPVMRQTTPPPEEGTRCPECEGDGTEGGPFTRCCHRCGGTGRVTK